MKFFRIKRKTVTEKIHSIDMRVFTAKVTYIKKHFFGLPIKTIHKYSKTYCGEVKDYDDCDLFI
jgi:hypothetical protein